MSIATVPDVVAAVKAFKDQRVKQTIELQSKGLLPDRLLYTMHEDNLNGNENHFQGIAVIDDGRALAVSGSNWREPSGDVLTFSLQPQGTNPLPVHGVARLSLDAVLWHAGGIDAAGDVIAVPIEYPHWTDDDPGRFVNRVEPPQFGDRDLSRIHFVDFSTVTPRLLDVRIERNGILATCAGFTQLINGRYAVLVLSQPSQNVRVDCYLSRSADLRDGFQLQWEQSVDPKLLANHQSVSMLTDAQGTAFLAAFSEKTSIELDLYRIGDCEGPPASWKPELTLKDIKISPADARAGCTLTPVNGLLTLWGVSHFRDPVSGAIRIVQVVPKTVPIAVQPGPAMRARGAPSRIKTSTGQFKLTAVKDPFDFRDLMYKPRLIEVPTYVDLKQYQHAKVPVLNQRTTSACTGFALATVIHYLQRKRAVVPDPAPVSARMIYQMAKRYDEWPGKRYQGSSCRGAMKAWQKHGVCAYEHWPDNIRQMAHVDGWTEAFRRPLGAYYRVNHKDLISMHAAIAEVGVLYVSAQTHGGWDRAQKDGTIPWEPDAEQLGGHAFAIVAYDDRGFWLQNSWGKGWGKGGFALLTYDDWLANGDDAWVARLGAPVTLHQPRTTSRAIQTAAGGTRGYVYSDLRPHVISTGNNGELRTSGMYGTDEDEVARLVTEDFIQATSKWQRRRLVLYAHGGLVGEDAALQRLADYAAPFREAELYLLGFVWRTDFWTTITNILQDGVRRRRAEGPIDAAKDFMLERLDDGLEAIARNVGGPLVWREMKQNAELATTAARGGAYLVANHLVQLRQRYPELELHFIAHSAGSIYFGRMLQYLTQACGLSVDSVTLWAPAITMARFRDAYLPALRDGQIKRCNLFTLNDDAERGDHCANIYHKSLLYLVSHALEKQSPNAPRHAGTPLLGMAKYVGSDPDIRDLIRRGRLEWINAPSSGGAAVESQATAHGAFDDDVATVHATLRRILPAGSKLPAFDFPRTASSRRDRRELLNAI